MIQVQVWSDFVCPFCMIAEQPLLDAVAAFGAPVDIEWMPFELRPHPTPTLRPEDAYLQTVWPQSVYPVAARFGVQLKLPSVSPQPYSALAWQGYLFAKAQGKVHAYNDRVLRAFFQQDRDIGRIEVLTQIARQPAFVVAQLAPVSQRQLAQLEGADGQAPQLLHRVAGVRRCAQERDAQLAPCDVEAGGAVVDERECPPAFW